MRYLSIWTPDPKTAAIPPTAEYMAAMGRLMEESKKSGELIDTGGMFPISKGGAHVVSSGGHITVTDGPFAEAKEVVCGWAILEAPTREAAIASVKRFMAIAGDGTSELRQMMGPDDVPHP